MILLQTFQPWVPHQHSTTPGLQLRPEMREIALITEQEISEQKTEKNPKIKLFENRTV